MKSERLHYFDNALQIDQIRNSSSNRIIGRMVEAQTPRSKDILLALTKATTEVKYVFDTLSITPRTFVVLVNNVGFESVEDIMNQFIYLDEIEENWNVQLGTGESLYNFAVWHKQFEEINHKKPEVLEKDFNKEVWQNHLRRAVLWHSQPNGSCQVVA